MASDAFCGPDDPRMIPRFINRETDDLNRLTIDPLIDPLKEAENFLPKTSVSNNYNDLLEKLRTRFG